MGCHKLIYNDNFSSLKVVYNKLSSDKTLYKYKYQWDYIHDPQSGFYMFQDEEEAAMMNSHMSKESIKNIIDLIRNDNIAKENKSDLTLYAWSKGVTANLELTSDFILDYIEVKIKSGKSIGTEENPLLFEALTINPMKFKYENTTTPSGQEGNFVKVYYTRLDKASPPATGYSESDSLAVSFVIKTGQKELFKDYLLNNTYTVFNTDNVNSSVTESISIGENANPEGAACNICIREAINRIANNDVLFSINQGKISRIGKANDIYNDFQRWFKNSDYLASKTTFVNPLLQDNLDWEKEYCLSDTNRIKNLNIPEEEKRAQIEAKIESCNNTYDNRTIEDYRSNIEITEFELISGDITATVGNQECQIPDFNYLQHQANNGVLIIGIRKRETLKSNGHYRSGHIVMIVPISDVEAVDESRPVCQSVDREKIFYPMTLECGSDIKVKKWIGDDSIQNMVWYRYKLK